MEKLTALLTELEQITFQQISEIPTEQQHLIAEQIEILKDHLRILARKERVH